MKRKILIMAAGAIMALLPIQAQKKFVFTPQWTAQAQFAGYYVAKERGFYKQAGLDVDIVHPSVTQTALSRMHNNQSQATTLTLCQALEIIDDGVDVVNILQTSMNTGMVLVSRKDEDPLKQRGMKVGIWNAGFGQLAVFMNTKEHLNYEWVRFASSINLFLSGAIDATLAMSYNEYYQLAQAGVKLTKRNVYRFSDHHYNVQEDGLYMNRDYYNSHRDEARRFAEASRKGWEWAAKHPDETLDIVMDYVRRGHIGTNRMLQKLMLTEVLRLLVDRESKKRDYRLRPDMVKMASQLMLENKMLKKEVKYEQIIAK